MTERDRIELLMKSYDLSPSQFADRAGIQRASVSHILSGRNKPSLEVMLKIYESFPGLNMEWLMTGKGEGPMGDTSSVKEGGDVLIGLFGNHDDVKTVASSATQVVSTPPQETVVEKNHVRSEKTRQTEPAPQTEKRKASQVRALSLPVAAQRKVKEIRIFYSDGTYETLFPERG